MQAYQGGLAVEPTAYTHNNGRYEINGLTPGQYTVIPLAINEELDVDNPGPGDWAARGAQVSVSIVQENTGVNFQLERGGLVQGTVINSSTGEPASNEFIGARVAGCPLQTQMTDDSGHYVMRVPAGPAIINPVTSQFNIDEGVRQQILVPSDGTVAVNLSVNGKDDFNFASGTVLDANGRPASGAAVVALGGFGGGTKADAQGHFMFARQNMPDASNLYACRGGELTPIGTPAFDYADPNHIALKMQRGYLPVLSGCVLTVYGKSIRAAKVTIVRVVGNAGTIYAKLTADANGRYTSPGLWSGFSYGGGRRGRRI